MAPRKSPRDRDDGRAGCLFWLALFCVVLLLFLLNIGNIKATLERTNFRDIVRIQREPGTRAPVVEPVLPETTTTLAPAAPSGTPRPPASTTSTTTATTTPKATTTTVPAQPTAARSREASLYFVHIDDDGVIVRLEVKRRIAQTDSPLRDALLALLAGPSAEELGKGLVSLIPRGTSLLSVQVRGATAWINLSEAFMYNNYGVEGYAGQLKQLVYTATAFPSVQDVQVLIDGQKREYLGGEGVYIGRPLSRNSF